jgi:hypothetical protein
MVKLYVSWGNLDKVTPGIVYSRERNMCHLITELIVAVTCTWHTAIANMQADSIAYIVADLTVGSRESHSASTRKVVPVLYLRATQCGSIEEVEIYLQSFFYLSTRWM